MLHVMDNIPVTVTPESVLEKLKVYDEEDINCVTKLFEKAVKIARPKAIFREAFIEDISGESVKINDITFTSKVLAATLKDVHRVFAYVCTCGREVDDWSKLETDYVVSLWLDIIKEMILHEATKYFMEQLIEIYQMEQYSTINPGSGDKENWGISQQVKLFKLIDGVESEIGVTLTDSFLMLPIKSVSGLLFPSEGQFSNCALCTRENCIGRKVPFDSEKHAAIFNR